MVQMALKHGTMKRVSCRLLISVGLLWLAVLMLKWGLESRVVASKPILRPWRQPWRLFLKPWCVWGGKPGDGRIFQRPCGFYEVP